MNVIALEGTNARLSLFVVKLKLKSRKLISVEMQSLTGPCGRILSQFFNIFTNVTLHGDKINALYEASTTRH
jgi:hypothetical protein